MAITTNKPVAVANPEIPFDKVAVGLVIQPIFRDREVSASAVLSLRTYRQLPDGTVECRSASADQTAFADLFAAAARDKALAEALASITTALQRYLNARGL